MGRKIKSVGLIIAVSVLVVGGVTMLPAAALVPGNNTLVSYNSTNTAPSGSSGNIKAHTSASGEIIVWSSQSHDIVSGDTSTGNQLYHRNMRTGATLIVSLGDNDVPVGSSVNEFAVSSSGRYVAFSSISLDVVNSPTLTLTNRHHLYIRDTLQNTTKLVDTTSTGVPASLTDGAASRAMSVSDDGRFVGFTSSAANLANTSSFANPVSYVKDLNKGDLIKLATSSTGSLANSNVYGLKGSCDGSIFVFYSNATNLTPEDDGQSNTYVVDMRNGLKVSNITHSIDGDVNVHSISCNGRYLILASAATNLTPDIVDGLVIHLYRYDRLEDKYSLIDKSSSGHVSTSNSGGSTYEGGRLVGDDGKVVFFGRDANLVTPAAPSNLELYVRNPEENTTELVPIDSSGIARGLASGSTQVLHNLEISASGDKVVYNSFASNLIPGIGSGLGKKLVLSELE